MINVRIFQQNGVAENKNKVFETSVFSMLSYVKFLKCYWAEAVVYVIFIQNRIEYASVQDKIFFELWTGLKFDIFYMRVFGLSVYVYVYKDLRKKFELKFIFCIFIGFTEGIKGYKVIDRQLRKVIYFRDVIFVEGVEFYDSVGVYGLDLSAESEDEQEVLFIKSAVSAAVI